MSDLKLVQAQKNEIVPFVFDWGMSEYGGEKRAEFMRRTARRVRHTGIMIRHIHAVIDDAEHANDSIPEGEPLIGSQERPLDLGFDFGRLTVQQKAARARAITTPLNDIAISCQANRNWFPEVIVSSGVRLYPPQGTTYLGLLTPDDLRTVRRTDQPEVESHRRAAYKTGGLVLYEGPVYDAVWEGSAKSHAASLAHHVAEHEHTSFKILNGGVIRPVARKQYHDRQIGTELKPLDLNIDLEDLDAELEDVFGTAEYNRLVDENEGEIDMLAFARAMAGTLNQIYWARTHAGAWMPEKVLTCGLQLIKPTRTLYADLANNIADTPDMDEASAALNALQEEETDSDEVVE